MGFKPAIETIGRFMAATEVKRPLGKINEGKEL